MKYDPSDWYYQTAAIGYLFKMLVRFPVVEPAWLVQTVREIFRLITGGKDLMAGNRNAKRL